jgi:hypothetical protein
VRIARAGNVLSGYSSVDGQTWILRGSVTIALPTVVYIGLAATSHSDGVLTSAVFDNVSLSTTTADTTPPSVPTGVTAVIETNAATLGAVTPFTVGMKPHGVAIGDVNEDGHVDLVASDSQSGTATALVGNGSGGFTFRSASMLGTAPKFVALGDLNEDGHLDLASADQDSLQVSVLLGKGDGTFLPRTAYGTCNRPHEITLADLNGDGHLDVVTPCHGGSVISVLLGNGNGTLQPATNFESGAAPHSVAIGDFNGDGRPDIAVANHSGANVSILLGNGNGSFAAAVTYGTADGPHSVRTADLNGDGRRDLVTANDSAGSMSVLLGNGNGTFQTRVNYAAGVQPKSVALGNINGDAFVDAVVANTGGNYPTCCNPGLGDNVSVFYGKANGTFDPQQQLVVGLTPFAVVLVDLNADGASDLVTANYDADSVGVSLASGGKAVRLTWQASNDGAGSGVSGYRIYRNGAATPLAATTTPVYLDSSIVSAGQYSYRIAALDGANPANESAQSVVISVTVP